MIINKGKIVLPDFTTSSQARNSLTSAPIITIGEMPFARTVTVTGSITISGTSFNAKSISWTSSPSGASGTVSGDLDNWSTTVSITPDAAGEGIETITFTASNDYGSATDSETVGFYIPGAHTVFLAQNVNNNYNIGLANDDTIGSWENLGSSPYNATQALGISRPIYKSSQKNGQPMVYFDGSNDSLLCEGSATSDWNWLTGNLVTVESVAAITDNNTWTPTWSTLNNSAGGYQGINFTSSTVSYISRISTATNASSNTAISNYYFCLQANRDDARATDVLQYVNGSQLGSTTGGTGNAGEILTLGYSTNSSLTYLTGYIWRISLYQSALSTTQLDINKAIDEWALGGTLPLA